MGKRELVIALAFIVAGAIAYQLTAPPLKTGEQGFSLSRLLTKARREIRGNNARASFTHKGTVPASTEMSELRLEGQVVPGRVRLIGEPRADIAYELNVDSTGPDPESALAYAKQVAVKTDDLGRSMTLRFSYPREGRQVGAMTVRLPARLRVLVAGASGLDVSNVAAVHLDNVTGDCSITGVAGVLSGVHRNGSLRASNLNAVKMSLQRSRARFERVEQAIALDVRDGESYISDARGPVDLDEARADITIVNPNGPVRVGGTDGRIALTNPGAESKVDVRRAEIVVQLSQSVPLTLLTTEDTLRLLLDGPPHVSIDAVANLGRVQADDFDLQPETVDQESRVAHAFGGAGGARVSLRNLRGEIVIKNFRSAAAKQPR